MTSLMVTDQLINKFCSYISFIRPIAGNIKRSPVLLIFDVNT